MSKKEERAIHIGYSQTYNTIYAYLAYNGQEFYRVTASTELGAIKAIEAKRGAEFDGGIIVNGLNGQYKYMP